MAKVIQSIYQLSEKTMPITECYKLTYNIQEYIKKMQILELLKALKELDIPYQGIVQSSELEEDVCDNCYGKLNNKNLIEKNLDPRTDEMVQNVFIKALPLLQENHGIVWVECGLNEIHTLASKTMLYIKDKNLNEGRSFTILPISCFSGYETNSMTLIQEYESKNTDKKIDCSHVTDVTENGKFNFISQKFAQLMTYVEESYRKPNVFHIPNWNDEKAELVKVNGGIVQQINGDDATISIAPEKLLQSLRDQLGINRIGKRFHLSAEKIARKRKI